jgi:hypothetical protein
MEQNTAELDPVPPSELDPRRKPFWRPAEMKRLGMGSHQTVLDAIEAGDIPVTKVGRKLLIPTAWIRRQMQLPELDASPEND